MNYLRELVTTYVEQLEWWVLAILVLLFLMNIVVGYGVLYAVAITLGVYTLGWLIGYVVLRPIILRMAEKRQTGE